jgi:hypothetical protein
MAVDTGDHAFPNRTVGAKPVQQDEEWVAAAALSEPDPTFSGFRRCHIPISAQPTRPYAFQNIIHPQGANGVGSSARE